MAVEMNVLKQAVNIVIAPAKLGVLTWESLGIGACFK